MSEVIDNLIVDWEKLLFGFGLLLLSFLIFVFNQYRKAQKKKVEQKKTDDLKEVIESLTETKAEPEKSFIDIFMNNPYIDKLICELKDDVMCDLVGVFVTENIEMGIEPKDIDENRYDIIHITHECKNKNAVSQKELHVNVKVHHMLPVIQAIKDSKKGILVINSRNEVDGELKGLFDFAGGLKQVIDAGIYRPAFGQRRKYLIGGIIVVFARDERPFLKEDLAHIATVRDQVGSILDMLFDEYLKNQ